jgi:hypothetical protein
MQQQQHGAAGSAPADAETLRKLKEELLQQKQGDAKGGKAGGGGAGASKKVRGVVWLLLGRSDCRLQLPWQCCCGAFDMLQQANQTCVGYTMFATAMNLVCKLREELLQQKQGEGKGGRREAAAQAQANMREGSDAACFLVISCTGLMV